MFGSKKLIQLACIPGFPGCNVFAKTAAIRCPQIWHFEKWGFSSLCWLSSLACVLWVASAPWLHEDIFEDEPNWPTLQFCLQNGAKGQLRYWDHVFVPLINRFLDLWVKHPGPVGWVHLCSSEVTNTGQAPNPRRATRRHAAAFAALVATVASMPCLCALGSNFQKARDRQEMYSHELISGI